MPKIKQVPEDFIVEEMQKFPRQSEGAYSYFQMRKRSMNTYSALEKVARHFSVRLKEVGAAGSKDKNAVTHQLISIRKKLEKDENISENLSLKFVGRGGFPVSLGELNGNIFTIIIRDLSSNDLVRIQRNREHLRRAGDMMTNYFDEQRFSSSNIEVGQAIIRKDYHSAISLLIEGQKSPYSFRVREYLESYPRDYLGALRLIPRRLLLLFVHAVQSHIWNETVNAYLASSAVLTLRLPYSRGEFFFPCGAVEQISVPIIGFGSELDNVMKRIIGGILNEHGIKQGDFINRSLPEVSVEGSHRQLFMHVRSLEISDMQDDELNNGRQKVTISFSLQPGSYATLVARFLLEAPEHR